MDRSVSTVASVQCEQGWVMDGQDSAQHGQEPAPVLLHCDKGTWIGASPRCKGKRSLTNSFILHSLIVIGVILPGYTEEAIIVILFNRIIWDFVCFSIIIT